MSKGVEEFLSNLLGQDVSAESLVRLTSGQRARLVSWSDSNGIKLNRSVIRQAEFTVNQAIDTANGGIEVAQPDIRANTSKGYTAPENMALQAIGIDIQSIDELLPDDCDFKSNDEIRHIFSMKEISYAEARGNPRETLAGIFAAKESLLKASPDLVSRPLPDIEILPNADGAPEFPGFALSISHSAGFAVACAISQAQQSQDVRDEDVSENENGTDASLPVQTNDQMRTGIGTRKFVVMMVATLLLGMSIPSVIEMALGCSNAIFFACSQ